MKILLSCNDNPDYRNYWPVVRWMWQYLGYEPRLYHVSEDSCFKDDPLVTVVEPLDYHDVAQSQIARIWGCLHFPDEVCVTADMDLFLLQRNYIKDIWNRHNLDGECMVAYFHGEWFRNAKRCNMQYIAGLGRNWATIMECDRHIQWCDFFPKFDVDRHGWPTDEVELGKLLYLNNYVRTIYLAPHFIDEWRGPNQNHRRFRQRIYAMHTHLAHDPEKLKNGYYIDVSSREYSRYISGVAKIWDQVYDDPLPIPKEGL